MRNLHFLSIIVLKKKAGEIEQLGGEQRAQQRVVSRNSNEAIGQCASRLLDDPRRLVSPYTPLQCPSLPYPITLFNADSASAESSATTIGSQPDECRFSFWTIRPDADGPGFVALSGRFRAENRSLIGQTRSLAASN